VIPLPLGPHVIRASHPGYETHQQPFELRNDQTLVLPITLKRRRGTLIAETSPPGLDAEVGCVRSEGADARELTFTFSGRTPVMLDDLPTGDYRFVAKRAGWPDYEKVVTVTSGETTTVFPEFAEGTLVVESVPSLGEIWMEGRQLGKTPVSLVFPEGEVSFTVKKEGFVDQTVRRLVKPRQTDPVSIILQEIDPVDKFLDRLFQPRRFQMKAPVTSREAETATSAASEFKFEDLSIAVTKDSITGSYKETSSFRFPSGKRNKAGRNSGSYTLIRHFNVSREEVGEVLHQELDPSLKDVFEPVGEKSLYRSFEFPGTLGPTESGEKGIFLRFPEPQILIEDGLPPVVPTGDMSMNPAYRAINAGLGGFLVVDAASGRVLRVETGVKGGGRSKLNVVEIP
ncbi:MAG: PEGA domain-containing protein, partial [Candidatus Omnitrophica bacterium]|nr:PEGA domain-containing protein [Candidatus Omnitrophota bacterium]